jgi:cell division septal protein FtsQ
VKVVINKPGDRKSYSNLPAKGSERNTVSRPKLLREVGVWDDEPTTTQAPKFENRSSRSTTSNAPELLGYSNDAEETTSEELEENDASGFEEEPQSWRHTRWGAVYFFLALGVLGTVAYVATHYEGDLTLDRIRVEGAHFVSDQEVIALAAIDRNQKFYDIDLHAIAERIEKHSLVKVAYPRRETNPSTIVLSITERQPAAILRSASGETLLIDREGALIRPKKLEGLRDPTHLLQVPLLSGVDEKDSASYRSMTKLVLWIQSLDSGALTGAIGELHRTPTGGFVLYTLETQTPIFLGSQRDAAFMTSTEASLVSAKHEAPAVSLFMRQVELLAKVWRKSLSHDLELHPPLYVDARFDGEIILKKNEPHHAGMLPHVTGDSTKQLAMLASNEHASNRGREQSVLSIPNAAGASSHENSLASKTSGKTSNGH